MKRISYTTNDEGNFVSNLFPLHSDMAFIMIFVNEKKCQIRGISNEGTVRILSECTGKDLHTIKINARKEMIKLGYEFKDEVRSK